MSEKQNRLMARKRDVWEAFIQKGILLPIVYDIETFGLSRMDVPHPVKGTPVLTEYAHASMDIAGNLVDTTQILPRRPETLLGDPEAPLVLRKSPQEFDDPERTNYFDAMAQILWEMERAPYRYEEFAEKMGDEKVPVRFRAYNSVSDLKKPHNKLEKEEEVIPVPLIGDDGEVVYDVRYHPVSGKVAYRVDEDPSSEYHVAGYSIHYYKDLEDGSTWRFVEPRGAVFGFNNKNFDNPAMRLNWMRAGVHPANLFSMYSRATLSSKQRQKNFSNDVRAIVRLVSIYGPQGEDKLKLSEKVDSKTGETYISESLGGIVQENTHLENFLRNMPGGITMPDGSLPDLNLAHGAEYDARMTMGILAYCIQKAPYIVSEYFKQADENYLREWLTRQDREGEKLPLFSMPIKNYPHQPYDSLYAFVGSDVQLGNFKKYLFMKTDGTLHKATYNNKPLHELSEEEWAQYMDNNFRNPEKVVRAVSFRKWLGALHVDDVLANTEAGSNWRNNLDDVEQDLIYIKEHPEMLEKVRCAVEELNGKMREEPPVHNPRIEDDLFKWGFGDPPYTQAIIDERRANRRENGGRLKGIGPLEAIRSRQTDDYRFLNMIDDAMYRLFITPHMADVADANHPELNTIIDNYNDLLKRIRIKFKKKNVDYLKLIDDTLGKHKSFDVKNPVAALQKIKDFRWKLKRRMLDDYMAEMGEDSLYAQGFVSADDMHKKPRKKQRLLLATAYRGDSYNTPQVVDSAGRALSMEYLSSLEKSDVFDRLGKGEWKNRFFRARSNPAIDVVLTQYAEYGRLDELPKEWQEEYQKQKQLKLHGRPNENEMTTSYPNIATFKHKLKSLEMNVSTANVNALERAIHDMTGMTVKLENHEEARRIIANCKKWISSVEEKHKYDTKLEGNNLFDPESGLPYDYIQYELPKEDHVVLDVPAYHVRGPVKQYDVSLPENCLVIPKPDAETVKKIEKGTPVIVREKETGRMYHTGPATIHKSPKETDENFGTLYDQAKRAYEHAKLDFPDAKDRVVLGVEGLYPVANTRKIDAETQTFKLPSPQFDGMVYHDITNLPKQVSGLIVPAEYVAQSLKPGDKVRIREAHGEVFDNVYGDAGKDTGHVYDTKLERVIGLDKKGKPKGITLKQLFKDIDAGKIDIETTGFQSKSHIERSFREWAKDLLKSDFNDLKVLVAEFKKVSPKGWGYWQPQEAPRAAMVRDKYPIPPSAYQPGKKEG